MPYPVYKLIHFLGIFVVVVVVAATCMHVIRGGTRADNPHRRAFAMAHGIAALLILLGGFGMLARLENTGGGLPGWVIAKLVIWVALVAALAIPYRASAAARALLIALPFIALAGGAVALYKPF